MKPLDVLDALPPGDGPHAAAATPAETARRLSLTGVRKSVWEALRDRDAREAQRSAGSTDADEADAALPVERPDGARQKRQAPEPALFEDQAERRATVAVRRHLKVLAAAGVVREVAPGQWMRDEAVIARRTDRRGLVRLSGPVEPRRLRVVPGPPAPASVPATPAALAAPKRIGPSDHAIGAWEYYLRNDRFPVGRNGKPLLAGMVDARTGREVEL